jgi:serine/threonine protein kinase
MPAQPQPGARPPTTGLTWLDEVIEQFEDAWERGDRPAIANHLPEDPARRPKALAELVQVDLERRLKQGEALRVESYLQQFPELTSQPNVVVGLIQAEFAHRRRSEPTLTLEEYLQRFPHYQEELKRLIPEQPTGPATPSQGRLGTGPETSGSEEELPSRLGRYRVEKALGAGGFGRVYLAHDERLNRPVAIKVARRERIATPQDAEAYLTEARVLASLDHPHIVPVHDVGQTDTGLPFVVSKFIEGSDLAQRIRETRFSFSQSAQLVATVAEALQYAHQKRLVHRDLKPANILLDKDNNPYLTDFGLALREEDFGRGQGIAGTPAYMSPEQANGEGHLVDGRSDIFSLGVVFYEMLTGRRPFVANENVDLLRQITSVEVRPPRQLDLSIPKELERICLKALTKRPTERYTTAFDLAEDLRRFVPAGETPKARKGKIKASPRQSQSGGEPLVFAIQGQRVSLQASVGQLGCLGLVVVLGFGMVASLILLQRSNKDTSALAGGSPRLGLEDPAPSRSLLDAGVGAAATASLVGHMAPSLGRPPYTASIALLEREYVEEVWKDAIHENLRAAAVASVVGNLAPSLAWSPAPAPIAGAVAHRQMRFLFQPDQRFVRD